MNKLICAIDKLGYHHVHACIHTQGIIAGALGTLAGAFLTYFVKAGKKIAIMNWVITLIAVFPLVGFFFYCPNLNVVGVNVNYNNK